MGPEASLGESEDKKGISTWRLFDFGRDAPIVNAATSRDRDVLHAVVHVGDGESAGARIIDLFPLYVASFCVEGAESSRFVADKYETSAGREYRPRDAGALAVHPSRFTGTEVNG